MERFRCLCESQPELFFDSFNCMVCGRLAGYSHELNRVTAFDPTPEAGVYFCPITGRRYRPCANSLQHRVCNGTVPLGGDGGGSSSDASGGGQEESFCLWCRFNQTIPDLSVPNHLALWSKMEAAKRRALHTLTRLGLAIPDRTQDPDFGLAFNFITDRDAADHFQSSVPNCDPVYTGHVRGVITINLAEADDVARARTRIGLDEKYRTLLGHFRHEIGHYYWERLVAPDAARLRDFRAAFGDENQDYQAALDRHYQQGPPPNWNESHISAYATMHPWEDWAETWAHYMHMVDTLETAKAFGFDIKPLSGQAAPPSGNGEVASLEDLPLPQESKPTPWGTFPGNPSIDPMMAAWIPFSIGLNALNRSMGMADAYPFVLTDQVREKLAFVHQVVTAAR